MRRTLTMLVKPWTLDEVSKLRRLIEEGTPPRAIAKKLSRTSEALHHMMAVEKLSPTAPSERRPASIPAPPPAAP